MFVDYEVSFKGESSIKGVITVEKLEDVVPAIKDRYKDEKNLKIIKVGK